MDLRSSSSALKGSVLNLRSFKSYSELLVDYIDPSSKLLDLGCGEAILYDYLRAKPRYFGIDKDEKALTIAKSKGIDVILGDLDYLPFQNSKFDNVVATELVEHIKDPVRLLSNIQKVLLKDGIALFCVPNENTLYHRLRFLFGKGLDDHALEGKDKHLHFPTISQSKKFFQFHFVVLKTLYWSSSGGRLYWFLSIFPESLLNWLANIKPELFARGIIFLCRFKP